MQYQRYNPSVLSLDVLRIETIANAPTGFSCIDIDTSIKVKLCVDHMVFHGYIHIDVYNALRANAVDAFVLHHVFEDTHKETIFVSLGKKTTGHLVTDDTRILVIDPDTAKVSTLAYVICHQCISRLNIVNVIGA